MFEVYIGYSGINYYIVYQSGKEVYYGYSSDGECYTIANYR